MLQLRHVQNCPDPFRSARTNQDQNRQGETHVREWDSEKMAEFLQEGLEIWAGEKHPDFEMRVAVSRQAEIRFENWKPEKTQAEALRAEIGEEIALVMEGIEPEDYLSE